ncbi:MAG: hypothetical protein E7679_00025 [Ruminococcaceae bacterium]|nr:hypothetical protein [Oscillospiraceae bacterium]
MQKKPSGLGRGLGDLLEDNSPVLSRNSSAKVVIRTEEKKITVSTAEIYETKPKNKSLKANFR